MRRGTTGWSERDGALVTLRRGLTAEAAGLHGARPARANRAPVGGHLRFLDMPLCLVPAEELLALLSRRAPDAAFAYVVTPNVDHVVRACRQGEGIRALYAQAWLSVCDSPDTFACSPACWASICRSTPAPT